MLSESAICYLDSLGRRGTLVSGSKLYNPAPHDSLPLLAVTCDPGDGSSSIQLISAQDGSLAKSLTLPSGMQAVECCWLSNELYFSAVSSDGFGIYRASDLSCVLPPKHRKIKQLRSRDGELLFVSDLSGVNEVYALAADGSSLHRLTSSRLGCDEFFLDPKTVFILQFRGLVAVCSIALWRTVCRGLPRPGRRGMCFLWRRS